MNASLTVRFLKIKINRKGLSLSWDIRWQYAIRKIPLHSMKKKRVAEQVIKLAENVTKVEVWEGTINGARLSYPI